MRSSVLVTGQFDHTEHDLGLADVVPLDVARTYDSLDKNRRSFGIGMTHAYDVFFFSQNQFQEVDLILPDGSRVHYARTSPGNGTTDAVFESSAPGQWSHSIITSNVARVGWDLRFRDGRVWFFPQLKPLTEMKDANGNVTKIIREGGGGKILQVVSPNGRSLAFSYNVAGLVSAVTDNAGRSVTYNYDAGSHLTEVIDPLGGTRTYTWDTTNHRITAIHDATGNLVIQNVYDTADRVTNQTLADGSTFAFAYTTLNGRSTQVDVTDRRGSVRRFEFDSAGYMVKNSFPFGRSEVQVTSFENLNGKVTASVDALNRRTEFQYDAAGNLMRVTRLAGTSKAVSTSTTYDSTFNVPLTITDANGNTTSFTYDGRGNLTSVTDPLGAVTTFLTDSAGRPLSSTDPLGRVSSVAYDGPDLASVTDPLGRQVHLFSDSIGRTTATVDQLGNRTVFDRDDLNRLVSSTDAMGGVTRFAYDAVGRLLSYTDARGFTAGYDYNALGKVKSFWDALFKLETRLYEAGGQAKQFIDRKGQLRMVTFDTLGRVQMVRFGATAANPTAYRSQVENTWDAGNRLVQIVDKVCANPTTSLNCGTVGSSDTIVRTYDDLDHKISEVTPQGEVRYTYDNVGRRTSLIIKNGAPGSQVVQPTITYTYDKANRLTRISQAAGLINANQAQNIQFTYDVAGQWTKLTLANGSVTNYTYDAAGQLTSIVYKKANGTAIGDLQYAYDTGGHKISVNGSLARINVPAVDVVDATYDASNRLMTWGGKTYSYDDDGNLIGDGTNTYQWIERNRLVSIAAGTTTLASFQYDSVGRRTAKTVGSTTTGFLYDGSNIAQELLGVHNTDAVKAHLISGGTDGLFLRIEGNDGTKRNSVLSDANSNAVMLMDATQQAVVSYTYEPYGMTTADTSNANTQQYTSRENDAVGNSQGLYYYRARYYMPGTARFVSEDPIGWTSGQANNYAYVGGNPIDFRDPFGLEASSGFENLSAGIGDGLTFGLTRWLRKKLGIDGVNTCSGLYAGGIVLGVAGLALASGGLTGGAEAGEAAAEGAEALAEEEAVAEGAGAAGAENAPNAIDPNKLHHIFGFAKHKLGPLLGDFAGSEEAAFGAISSATEAAVSGGGLTGALRGCGTGW